MKMNWLRLPAGGHRQQGWGFLPHRLPYESTACVQVPLILSHPSFTSSDPSAEVVFTCHTGADLDKFVQCKLYLFSRMRGFEYER